MQVSLAGPKEDLRNERFIELGKGNDRRGSFGDRTAAFPPTTCCTSGRTCSRCAQNADAAKPRIFVEANAVVRQVFVAFALWLPAGAGRG